MTLRVRLGLVLVSTALFACGPRNIQQLKPRLADIASPVDFGTVPVLARQQVEIPLENVGRPTLNISAVQLNQTDAVFELMSAPESVPGGSTDKLVLVFTPLAERSYQGTLSFETDDETHELVELALLGVGSTRAVAEAVPSTVDFGRVSECGSAVQLLTLRSKGTADLVVEDIKFADGSSSAFRFVGSTRTPVTVKDELQLTLRVVVEAGAMGPLSGAVVLRTNDPDQRELLIPLSATVNQAPVPHIAMLNNGAPGQRVVLDGRASTDADNDVPLTYHWTLRSKPLSSVTTIAMPDAASTEMTLDAQLTGAYEVQLDVTDSAGAKSCTPARATVVAAPAEKLLVEMYWDNPQTDLDLHVLRTPTATLWTAPDDCFYQNRAPDWGVTGDAVDNPGLVRDALTGYGPEVFGYVNPVSSTYRVTVAYENELLSTTPASKATVRVYLYGVLKAEVSRTLNQKGDIWEVFDVEWPTGNVAVLP